MSSGPNSQVETEPLEPAPAAKDAKGAAGPKDTGGSDRSVYLTLTLLLQGSLVVGFGLFVLRGDWENVFLTAIVIALTLLPVLLNWQYGVVVPPEFQFIAATFVYLSLFLGSARDFYYRFWWWDIVLHVGSGFLLGIVGFVALFLLNRTNRLPQGMTPGFVCFFAVTFAVFLGVLWEIFEFAVDQVAPHIDMQSNETGVADTMYDLIVDALGAVVVAVMGWVYMKTGRYSFIADAVRGFVDRNPKLFQRPRDLGRGLGRRVGRGIGHIARRRHRRRHRRKKDAQA